MKFGLLGYPLGHSFSRAYFLEKFQNEGLVDFTYENFPLPDIEQVYPILRQDLTGLNVTVPYKSAIIPYLNSIDRKAWEIGAVNTLVRTGPYSWKGINTDASGFERSLEGWLAPGEMPSRALILGNGGAAKAVRYVLHQQGIKPIVVSRSGEGVLRYEDLTAAIVRDHLLIINATPLGMTPDIDSCPPIPYEAITPRHALYDLVYNPSNTLFLTRGQQQGAKIMNGLRMLSLQAEEAWSIWKSYGTF